MDEEDGRDGCRDFGGDAWQEMHMPEVSGRLLTCGFSFSTPAPEGVNFSFLSYTLYKHIKIILSHYSGKYLRKGKSKRKPTWIPPIADVPTTAASSVGPCSRDIRNIRH